MVNISVVATAAVVIVAVVMAAAVVIVAATTERTGNLQIGPNAEPGRAVGRRRPKYFPFLPIKRLGMVHPFKS